MKRMCLLIGLAGLALGCANEHRGETGTDVAPPRLPPERAESGQVIQPSDPANPSAKPAPAPEVMRETSPPPRGTDIGATTQPAGPGETPPPRGNPDR